MNNFFQSAAFKAIFAIVAIVTVLIATLVVGMFIGYKKMEFSYSWAENYNRNFAGPKGGFFRDLRGQDYLNPHGVFGSILKIDNNILIVKGSTQVEKTIVVSDKTDIEEGSEEISLVDLEVDDRIAVIGEPNQQGQVDAKLIRVFNP